MEEEQNNQSTKIERLREGAIMEIKFGREFYQRLVEVLKFVYQGKTESEMLEAAKQIEDKKITKPWVMHYETMLYVVKAAEEFAQIHNLTESVDYETLRKEAEERKPVRQPKADKPEENQ